MECKLNQNVCIHVYIKVLYSNELTQQKTIKLSHDSMMLFKQVGQRASLFCKGSGGGIEKD